MMLTVICFKYCDEVAYGELRNESFVLRVSARKNCDGELTI